jgi:hypothetical protein
MQEFDDSPDRQCRESTTLQIADAGSRRLPTLPIRGVHNSSHLRYAQYVCTVFARIKLKRLAKIFIQISLILFEIHFPIVLYFSFCSIFTLILVAIYLEHRREASSSYCCLRYCMSSVQCRNFRTICGARNRVGYRVVLPFR